MPRPLFDLSTIDLNKVVADRADIEEAIPQRYEFAMLDGIIEINPDAQAQDLVLENYPSASDLWRHEMEIHGTSGTVEVLG